MTEPNMEWREKLIEEIVEGVRYVEFLRGVPVELPNQAKTLLRGGIRQAISQAETRGYEKGKAEELERIETGVKEKIVMDKDAHTPNCQRGTCKNHHAFCGFTDGISGFNEALQEVLSLIHDNK